MAERAFAKLGYVDNDNNFKPTDLRARDVVDSQGVSAEQHQTNTNIHLTEEQTTLITNAIQVALLGRENGVATLNADGKIPADQLDLAQYQTRINVETYEDMIDLTAEEAPVNSYIFVADATGDEKVEDGWAVYYRANTNDDATDYIKVAEGESIDITFPNYDNDFNELRQAAQEAEDKAVTADSKAVAAQSTADAAVVEAAKLDFAYCIDESDMASKNLRAGALVLMAVDNND